MIPCCSRTGSSTILAAMRTHGWGLLVVASGKHRDEGHPLIAVDSGAWAYAQRGEPFDEGRYMAAVAAFGARASFVVLPDIVEGGRDSLDLSLRWLEVTLRVCPRVLIAVQDGLTVSDLEGVLGPRVGVFVGGSTAWKEATMRQWGETARARGAYLHVGRVNTLRRLDLCADAGADSFDGTCLLHDPGRAGKLARWARKPRLWPPPDDE